MKEKKNLLKCAGFLLGLLILLLAASCLFRRKDGLYVYNSIAVSIRTQDIEAEPDNSLDVIFLGDSESYASFSPRQLYSEYGYTSYVCGTSGQKICDSYALLQTALKTQSPKVVVLETNCLYRKIKGKHSDFVMDFLTDSLPVFANHSDWKKLIRKMLPESRSEKRRSQKGFLIRKKARPYKGGSYMHKTRKIRKIPQEIMAYLEQIADLCKERDIKLLLVSTPSATNWSYRKHNGVQQWADAHNVSYVDLNLDAGIDIDWSTDTQDGGDHLNFNGATKVTHYMGKYFQSNYPLTDRRSESLPGWQD